MSEYDDLIKRLQIDLDNTRKQGQTTGYLNVAIEDIEALLRILAAVGVMLDEMERVTIA